MTRSLVVQALSLSILAVCCVVSVHAGPLDSPKTIAHDNGAVRYSSIAGGMGKGECNRVPSPCTNKWWTQNNEGGNSNLFRTTHTTAGPSAGFSFSFYGSRGVAILGKRDSNAVPAVTLNGRSYGLSGQQEPVLFSTEGLDPNVAYTLEMRYTGVSFLNVAALYLDQNGMVGTPPRDPDPTPEPKPEPDPKQTDPVISSPPPTTDQQSAPPTQSPPTSTTTTTRSEPDHTGQVDSSDQPASSRTSPPDSSGSGGETHGGDGEGPSVTDTDEPANPSETNGNDNMNLPGPGVMSPTQGSSATPGIPPGSGKKPNAGLMIGLIVGGGLFLLLLLLGMWYLRRRIHARRAPSYTYRQGRIPWLLGNSSERVPDAWERFGVGGGGGAGTNKAGTSRKNVTGHESFQAGMPSPGLPPNMDELDVQPLTRATTVESWYGRVV